MKQTIILVSIFSYLISSIFAAASVLTRFPLSRNTSVRSDNEGSYLTADEYESTHEGSDLDLDFEDFHMNTKPRLESKENLVHIKYIVRKSFGASVYQPLPVFYLQALYHSRYFIRKLDRFHELYWDDENVTKLVEIVQEMNAMKTQSYDLIPTLVVEHYPEQSLFEAMTSIDYSGEPVWNENLFIDLENDYVSDDFPTIEDAIYDHLGMKAAAPNDFFVITPKRNLDPSDYIISLNSGNYRLKTIFNAKNSTIAVNLRQGSRYFWTFSRQKVPMIHEYKANEILAEYGWTHYHYQKID